jgi:tetratricopeptide (TPR) repeat protein
MARVWLPAFAMTTLAVALLTAAAVPAAAAEPASQMGFVQIRSIPCAVVKYGNGIKCELPTLPETGNTQQLLAARTSRAQFFIDMGDLKSALGESDAALTLDPANVDIRHLVARLALSTGDFARAEREINTAIAQRPDDVDLHATHAVYIKTRAWLEEALHEFDDILTKRPDHRFSRQERATLLMSLARPDEAIADLNILIADRQDANLLALRGTAHLAMNDAQQAITDFTAALKEAPGRFDLLTGRAMAYEVHGDDQAALDDYDTLLGPVNGPPKIAMSEGIIAKYRLQRAHILVRQQHFAEASTEMMASISAGGLRSVLRAQIYLRRNGFPETLLDGKDSTDLRAALKSCFGLSSCFQKISDNL